MKTSVHSVKKVLAYFSETFQIKTKTYTINFLCQYSQHIKYEYVYLGHC